MLALVVVALLVVASPALANEIQVGYSGSAYGPYQADSGGEFTLNDINPEGWLNLSGYVAGKTSNFGGITSFQTFCIEGTEFLNPYAQVYNAKLSDTAMYGSQPAPGDPLSVGTGWLYSQFAQGILAGYNYSGTVAERKASAALLQNAIWWLEGEEGITYTASNLFMLAVVTQFGSQSGAQANGASMFGVYALNLWTGDDPTQNRAQDQLFYSTPDGYATLSLLGLGLCGLMVASRKMR